jgi:hypothetical protein
MGTVRVKTHWTVLDPLDDIPPSEWGSVVLERGRWIKNAIDYRLDKALHLLDEIEAREAWTAAKMDRHGFLRFVCSIEPDDLPRIREGYRIMRLRGEKPTSRAQALQAQVEQAEHEAETIRQGTRTDLGEHSADGTKLGHGSNSASHILRRLARDHRDVLAAYERGEFTSARAAGIAAGIVTPDSPLVLLRRAWRRASPDEQATFRAEINNAAAWCDQGITALLALYGECQEHEYEPDCIVCRASVLIRDMRALREEPDAT